ncbi:MAG TPA: hypothetical protein VMA83_00225 [Solirubrobacteraceae bacterium]|nr:hypothetical protein [Solirubrobacteraceae bacterium]
MSSNVVAALIAGGVSIVVSVVAAVGSFRLQRSRLRDELRTEFMAETAIRDLLLHDDWRLRSFQVIAHRIRGFEDDELRRLLIRAGAVCFDGKDGAEMWGLRTRNEDRLA